MIYYFKVTFSNGVQIKYSSNTVGYKQSYLFAVKNHCNEPGDKVEPCDPEWMPKDNQTMFYFRSPSSGEPSIDTMK
jgi:hypothetical protein